MTKLAERVWLSGLLFSLGCGGDSGPAEHDAGSSAAYDAAAHDAATPKASDAGDAGTSQASADAGSFGSANVVDCTAAGQSECIAAKATRSGMSLSCTGDIEDVSEFLIGTPTWTISCADEASEFAVQLEFPTQPAGALDLTATPGAPGDLKFYVESENYSASSTVGSMTESSTNLKSGKLTGSVGADNTLTGTLTAFWNTPTSDCTSGDSDNPCEQGALLLTFNVTAPGGGDTSALGSVQSCVYADGCIEFRMHTTSCYASDKLNCQGPLFDGTYAAGACPSKTYSSMSVDQTSCGETATFTN